MQVNHTARKRSSLIFDVGMHLGEDTHFYLKKGFSVVAFEADGKLVNFCRGKFAKELEEGRLVIVEGAIVETLLLGAGQATVPFFKNTRTSVWGTACEEWAVRNERYGAPSRIVNVAPIEFGKSIERHGMPYYLKIDIEGSDLVCVRALRKFDERPAFMSIESEKNDFVRLEEEISILEELGYTSFKAIPQHDSSCQSVPNPPLEGGFAPKPGSSGLFGKELPGSWQSKAEILAEYRGIFESYKLYRDHTWYDTHAKHGSLPDWI